MYEYKCVPIGLDLNSKDRLNHTDYIAENLEYLFNQEAKLGWEYQRIDLFQECSDTFTKYFKINCPKTIFYIATFRRPKN